MSDPFATDDALVTLLQNDATLQELLPDGVWWDLGPQNATAYGIVSLVHEPSTAVYGGRAMEDPLFAVKAVVRGSSASVAQQAAARIDALLDEQSLIVNGLPTMAMFRDEVDGRIHYVEQDDFDKSIRWQHCGGRYRVQTSHDPVGLTPPATQEQRP